MKILMLVPFLPNTSMSGGQTRWYNIIKYLAKDNEITLYSLIKDDSEKRFIPELEKYCKKVEVFKRSRSPWTARNLILTLFSFYPLLVIRNFSPKEKRALKKELREGSFDIIHAETFYVMPHVPKVKTPSILVEQTIEYLVYKHHVTSKVPLIFRPIFMLDVIKLKYWEKYYWKKTNRLVAVSDKDKETMEQLVPGIGVDVIPNGVDAKHFSDKPYSPKNPKRVLFVGNFKWLQNVEAVEILLKSLWPKIISTQKDAKLWIVGKSIPSEVKEAAKTRNDILISEDVADIRDAYSNATIMLVPLKGPGGTRLKVLEAMATGLPVISTTVGIEGLGVTNNKHVVIRDDENELVKETIRLLNDEKTAKKIGAEGRDFINDNFDWKKVVKLHKPIYESVI